MPNSNFQILVESGWREDRNEEKSPAYKNTISTCLSAGFVFSDSIAIILRQVFGLRIRVGNGFVSFENPEHCIDIYPDLKVWMDKNSNVFPIGEYNGDPLFIDSDQNLYFSNYDVVIVGIGGFFKSLSDILSSKFLSDENSISLPPLLN